ncbi:MAG: CPBP family intramembrane glutamic endopeptidase [Candidatus Binataceae bacterium]
MSLPPAEILADANAARVAGASASARSTGPQRVKILAVVFVLILGTEIPLRPIAQWGPPILSHFGWSPAEIAGAESILVQTIIAAAILLVVHFWERLPLRSIGIVRFAWSDLGLGIAAFAGIVLVEGFALPIMLSILTGSRGWGIESLDARQFALVSQWPWPIMIATAMTAGVYEEIWARGYAVERLEALTHSTIAAAAIALALDLGAHVPFWGIRYAILIAPCQILLLALYLWRRRLAPCMIAHALWDSARPIAIAIIWMLTVIHPIPSPHRSHALSSYPGGSQRSSRRRYFQIDTESAHPTTNIATIA